MTNRKTRRAAAKGSGVGRGGAQTGQGAALHLRSDYPAAHLNLANVSADCHRHPVGFFFSGVVEAHDRSAVEVFCYANGGGDDEITRRIRQAADHWRPIGALSDDAAEALIRSDRIDILVDLSGHTASNRLSLFSRRAAPVQASWLGYVATTGVPAMDYVITDAVRAPTVRRPSSPRVWNACRMFASAIRRPHTRRRPRHVHR